MWRHASFIWDGPTLVEQTHTTTTTTTWEHEGFAPIAQTTIYGGERSQSQVDAEFAAIITDLVGTPIRLLDADGATTWTSQASTWGATDADAAMPLRFPGQYHDTETGLFYNVNRYYNPDTGRYITADPLGLAPSPNPHTYVANPTTAIDPLGLSETHGLHENGTNAVEKAGSLLSQADLNPSQLSNLTRYMKKLPAGAEDTVITRGTNGAVQFSTAVPGRVPGSYATYDKVVDAAGTTIGYTKTTVLPDGTILHTKDKLNP